MCYWDGYLAKVSLSLRTIVADSPTCEGYTLQAFLSNLLKRLAYSSGNAVDLLVYDFLCGSMIARYKT